MLSPHGNTKKISGKKGHSGEFIGFFFMNQGFHGGSHKKIYFAYLFVIVCSFNKCVPCEPT